MAFPEELLDGNLQAHADVFRGVGDSETALTQHSVNAVSLIQYCARLKLYVHDKRLSSEVTVVSSRL